MSRWYGHTMLEVEPGKWAWVTHEASYVPDDDDDEWGVEWDYRLVRSTSTGTFATEDEAWHAMREAHGNPGGDDRSFAFNDPRQDERKALIAARHEAVIASRRRMNRPGGYW